MIRLLFLAPAIALIGVLFTLYMAFVRPVVTDSKGRSMPANAAIADLKSSLEEIKAQQDVLSGSIENHRQDLMLETTNTSKLYEQINNDEFADMDLVELKQSVVSFNQSALELAGNETALVQFNDQLREGIFALNKQIKDLSLADLLHPKDDVANRLNAMRIQVAKLTELQHQIIAKSKEYNERSKLAMQEVNAKLKEQSVKIKEINNERSAKLKDTINDAMRHQKEMLQRSKDQAENLENIRLQNAEQARAAKERVENMVEKLRDDMATARQKAQDSKDKAQDAKQRAADAKQRAEDAKQRAKDMQQALKDRMNR